MNFSKLSGLGAAFVFAAALSTQPASANFIQNPGFENGDFPPWVSNGTGTSWVIDPTAGNAFSGSFSAATYCVGAPCVDQNNLSGAASLSQTIAGLTAGSSYTLSFAYRPGLGLPNELKVLWDGNVVYDLTDL